MTESRRENLLIALAVLMIAGSLAVYAALIHRWLWEGPSAPAPERGTVAKAPDDPLAARLAFRERFLDPKSHWSLSLALYRSGRPVDAFYVALAAKEVFGELSARAHAIVVLGRDEDPLEVQGLSPSPAAESFLKARLASDPANPRLLLALARLLASRGALREAHKSLDLGLAARPEDRGLLSFKARLAAAADPMSAVPLHARLANASPDSYEGREALKELGRLALEKEDGPRAELARFSREALEELYRARPAHPLVFSTLAESLRERGDIDAVRAMAAEALDRHPGHAGALRIEGDLALQDRDTEKALSRYTAAWEKNPDDLHSASRLAQIYVRERSDPEGALPYYIALYLRDQRSEDGRPVEEIVRETLDARREQLLRHAGVEILGRYLGSQDASLRAQACVKAAELKDPRWVETLYGLLDDDAEIVRHNADYALYHIAKVYPDAVRVRRDEWLETKSPVMRARVLNLFADLHPQETFPLVLRALYDPDPALRFLAKTTVFDHYYEGVAAARKAAGEYLATEKNPAVLALYDLRKAARR